MRFLPALLVAAAPVYAQLHLNVYSDVTTDGKQVYGYASTSDTSNMQQCVHSAYDTCTTLFDPHGNPYSTCEIGEYSNAVAPVGNLFGTYTETSTVSLQCSCLGPVAGGGPQAALDVPGITAVQNYSATNNSYSAFQPLAGTPQSGGQYLIVYGGGLTNNGVNKPPQVSTFLTSGSGIDGFHLGTPTYVTETQINYPYWADADSTATSYTFQLATFAGTAQTQFAVSPPPSVTMQIQQYFQQGPAGFVLTGSDQNTTNLTATGNPVGGTFSWSLGSNLSFVGPSNTSNVSLKGGAISQSYGDTYAAVTYAVNSSPTTSSVRLSVLSDHEMYSSTLGGPQTTVALNQACGIGYITYITYYIRDQFHNDIAVPGVHITEYLSNRVFNYPVTASPATGTSTQPTNQLGAIMDTLSATCGVPSNFSGSVSQSFSVSSVGVNPQNTITYRPTYATISYQLFN